MWDDSHSGDEDYSQGLKTAGTLKFFSQKFRLRLHLKPGLSNTVPGLWANDGIDTGLTYPKLLDHIFKKVYGNEIDSMGKTQYSR